MEITFSLELSQEEESLVDMHSLLNVLNVVNHELLEIGELFDAAEEVDLLVEEVAGAAAMLSNPEKAQGLISGIEQFISKVDAALDRLDAPQSLAAIETVGKHRDNLRNIFAIIRIRAAEIRSRHAVPDEWVRHRVTDLKGRFAEFLQAVEKNSHGGYRIVNNLADQGQRDYLINFEVTSEDGDFFSMPIVFQDVMRDILANARKYTPPGGKIRGGLHCGRGKLRFVVEDSGIGIPEGEIVDVVRFGHRARNVLDRPTFGGGFGLTKAYYVTRRYSGRMWIESGPKGTTVEIMLPLPAMKRPTEAV